MEALLFFLSVLVAIQTGRVYLMIVDIFNKDKHDGK